MEEPIALGFACKKLNNIVKHHIYCRMAQAGFDEVTIMHGYIMGYLYRNRDRDIFQRDIEQHFGITKSTVTSIIKLMEKKGYVYRQSVESDARLKKLTLTDEGINMHLKTIQVIDRLHMDMEQGITDEEKTMFRGIINKMTDNLRECKEEHHA